MLSGGAQVVHVSQLRRVTDSEELGDARAAHDGCDHCCAKLVGVHLDTECAGGIGAHRHTERGSLIHEEHGLPLCCEPAAHCGRRRPACGVHGGSQHEDDQAARRSQGRPISDFRTVVATLTSRTPV